jgi:hypothetical protein
MTTKDIINTVMLFSLLEGASPSVYNRKHMLDRLEGVLMEGSPIIIGIVPACCFTGNTLPSGLDERITRAMNKSESEMLLISECNHPNRGLKRYNGRIFMPNYAGGCGNKGESHALALIKAAGNHRELYETIRPFIYTADTEKFDTIFKKYLKVV